MTLIVAALIGAWLFSRRIGPEAVDQRLVHVAQASDLEVRLYATQALHVGRNDGLIEFRSVQTGRLAEVGEVHVTAAMNMPGMAMPGDIDIAAREGPGRYSLAAQFGMAGSWRFSISWNGPAGTGSLAFDGDVR